MAKPFENEPGSSCHIHLSVFDKNGKNIFVGDDVVIDEESGLRASNNLIYFLGGWMEHVLDVFPFYA
jgi:glutamine synthetase